MKRQNHLDLKEDKQFGRDLRSDEIPAELAFRESRLAKIKEAMAALEAEAELAREEDKKKRNDKNDPPAPQPPKGKVKYNKKTGTPKDKAQISFTDPESRIMRNADKAFVQAYNAQAVVDDKNQIIVAAVLTNQAADSQHLPAAN